MRVAICDDNQQDIERIRRYTLRMIVSCIIKIPIIAEGSPQSCRGNFPIIAEFCLVFS